MTKLIGQGLLVQGLLMLALTFATPSLAQSTDANHTHLPASTSASSTQNEKTNFAPVFIALSDAMSAIKAGDTKTAQTHLQALETAFHAIYGDGKAERQSEQGQAVLSALTAVKQELNLDNLNHLSKALYAYEQAQNPADHSAGQAKFKRLITPALAKLTAELADIDPSDKASTDKALQSYHAFNRTWVANERVVRNSSRGHYGQIETSMALLRVALESDPVNVETVQGHLKTLSTVIDEYNSGKSQAVAQDDSVTVATGVALLEDAQSALKNGDKASAQAHLSKFLQIWVIIEGDVGTRNAKLYSDIESQIPTIMAKGDDPKQQATLARLIAELKTVSTDASYSATDAMLILLREGLEALLIIMALLSAVRAASKKSGPSEAIQTHARTQKAISAIYVGAGMGLVLSLVGAWALYQLFDVSSLGTHREFMEGMVGIVAVLMMLLIGAWLHSKSSLSAWHRYIKSQTAKALTAGSVLSLFVLSFLSVFREGAETVLFYVGILPKIAIGDFILGIGLALAVLAVVAIIFNKSSRLLPIPHLFKILTFLIYALAFKILGVSMQALALTGHIPMINVNIPAIASLGIYPNLWGLIAQGALLLLVAILIFFNSASTKKASI